MGLLRSDASSTHSAVLRGLAQVSGPSRGMGFGGVAGASARWARSGRVTAPVGGGGSGDGRLRLVLADAAPGGWLLRLHVLRAGGAVSHVEGTRCALRLGHVRGLAGPMRRVWIGPLGVTRMSPASKGMHKRQC